MHNNVRRWALPLVVVVALVASLFSVNVASAVPPTVAPTGLQPADGDTAGGNPSLSWNALSGVERYRIQVSTVDNFTSTVINTYTYNTTFTPTSQLASGAYYWRVAGANGSDIGPYSATRTFDMGLDLPEASSPADGADLAFPTDAPTFAWGAVAGAKSYVVEVDDAPDFVGARKLTTPTTTVTDTATYNLSQTYYWRVRGATGTGGSGSSSPFSEVREFQMTWTSTPALVAPVDASTITEVVLEWTPVLGAEKYELQVNTIANFSGVNLVDIDVVGTVWSPAQTLDNDTYYWQVRPVDEDGHLGTWSDTFEFTRDWGNPSKPTRLDPSDGDDIVNPMTWRWTPVELAAFYELQVGTDPNFTQSTYDTCFTVHTSYSPYDKVITNGEPRGCTVGLGAQGPTYFWRVRGIDGDANVLGLWSNVSEETLQPWQYIRRMPLVTLSSPANNATVSLPVLDWAPVDFAARYEVHVVQSDGSEAINEVTYATSYTPIGVLDPADGPYRWYVETIDDQGNYGLTPNEAQWRTFNLVAPATVANASMTGPAAGTVTQEMPTLTWTAVTGADRYDIRYSVAGSGVYFVLKTGVRFNGYTHNGVPLVAGPYEFWVRAYNGNALLSESPHRAITIADLPDPVYDDLLGCTAPEVCLTSETPRLSWSPVANAAFYRVYLSLDASFTNVVRVYDVPQNTFLPREELPDNEAGVPYFWHVRPCKSPTRCSYDPQSILSPLSRAFSKSSAAVETFGPGSATAPGPVVENNPTFDWDDYLTTNGGDVEALEYRIQVATASTFANASIVDNKIVDQTTYTPFALTYPEGPLFWRVRAIDASGNELTWSPTLAFRKVSPQLDIIEPQPNANLNGIPTFRWMPQEFAASYVFELYKNGDVNFSAVNRIVNKPTTFSTYTPIISLPLGEYAWRVRREDATGKDGPWAIGGKLTIASFAPNLLSPTNNASFTTDTMVLTWGLPAGDAGVTSYKVQVSSSPTFASFVDNVTTVMQSWATTDKYPIGTYHWRVQALDADNNILGTSATRSFTRSNNVLPPVPTKFKIVASPGTGVITWAAPAALGSPALNAYVVTITRPGPVTTTVEVPSSTLSYTFKALINGTPYAVSVAAKNTAGVGPLVGGTVTPNGCVATPFADVASNSVFCTQIAWMFTEGISTGSTVDGNKLYKPADAVSRLAMAAFLHRYSDEPDPGPAVPQRFADVPPGSANYEDIQWMFESGLSTGSPNPTPGGLPLYKPAESVSRQAMAAFLFRFSGQLPPTLPAPFFADVGLGAPFYNAIQWMGDSGLSTGSPNPTPGGLPLYKPADAVSRQAMAAFLYRYDLEIV